MPKGARFCGVKVWLSCAVVLMACGPHVTDRDPVDADTGGSSTSRCTETADTIHCAHHTLVVSPGGFGFGDRAVHWQVPLGTAPSGGWPVVLMFQGSTFSADTFWDIKIDAPYGGWHQAHVTRALLDAGFAVITPKTRGDGSTFWDTNLVAFSGNWSSSDDHHLMLKLFELIAEGRFGALSTTRWFATGISSGGYMTSRMAVAWPEKFRALAIAAGSYATCAGALCTVPPLPSNHPPTLFLHGEKDSIVPIGTMTPYREALDAQKTPTRQVTDAEAGHEWLKSSPAEVLAWFKSR